MVQLERDCRCVGARKAQNGGSGERRHHRGQKRAAGKSHGGSRALAMRLN
jgi:hypothetical protein